jgi:hypothetical protein
MKTSTAVLRKYLLQLEMKIAASGDSAQLALLGRDPEQEHEEEEGGVSGDYDDDGGHMMAMGKAVPEGTMTTADDQTEDAYGAAIDT